jgi:CRP/FNR family transcriptional regulator, cyclic AMP receptor protein
VIATASACPFGDGVCTGTGHREGRRDPPICCNPGVRIRLLEEDPSLGVELPEEQRALARRHLTAPQIRLDRGEWEPERAQPHPNHLGYLITEGLMIREASVAGAKSIELLSLGDLLRPWLEDAASFVDARWMVVEAISLAGLDPPAASIACRWPPVVAQLIDRGLRRSRSLAVSAALAEIRGIDRRLWVLFWHLAERWGERERDGSILLPLRLTHETLAILVAARRPSVTSALARLGRQGLVERVPRQGWRLRGEAPEPRSTP